MRTENKSADTPKMPRRSLWLAFGLLAIVLLTSLACFLMVGRWLVVEDPLQKAQAIAVLSGRMPLRAVEAAKLYHQGYAPQVWLTHSTEPGATLREMGIAYDGEDAYNFRVLIHEGVPPEAIRVLDPPILNTADEMAAISSAMSGEKDSTVILVTSKVHTRRVRILWHRLSKSPERAIARAPADDSFDPGHWWRTTGDALDVVREVLGILNAWAGMPLRPAS